MTEFRAIIFDYDGTLVNLRATPVQMNKLREEVRTCLGEYGLGLALQPFYDDIDAVLARLEQQAPQAVAAAREQITSIIVRYEEEFSAMSDAKPFAGEVWRAAVQKSHVGIVSNNTASCIRPTLERLQIARAGDPYALVGFENVNRHKPHPDGISEIANALGLTHGQCAVYVGDTCSDLEACRRFNALGGAQLITFIVKGGKCDWKQVVLHPHFREATAITDLSVLNSILSN